MSSNTEAAIRAREDAKRAPKRVTQQTKATPPKSTPKASAAT